MSSKDDKTRRALEDLGSALGPKRSAPTSGEKQCNVTCAKCKNLYTVGTNFTSSYCPRCYIFNPTPALASGVTHDGRDARLYESATPPTAEPDDKWPCRNYSPLDSDSALCTTCGFSRQRHDADRPTAEPDERIHTHNQCGQQSREEATRRLRELTASPDAAERWLGRLHDEGYFVGLSDREIAINKMGLRKGREVGLAAGRAEVLKPLRDIYSRGRVTFRSDGNPDSVEAQEREFEAALDESGEGKK